MWVCMWVPIPSLASMLSSQVAAGRVWTRLTVLGISLVPRFLPKRSLGMRLLRISLLHSITAKSYPLCCSLLSLLQFCNLLLVNHFSV